MAFRDPLSHRVVASPTKTALIDVRSGEACTYTDLDEHVRDIAGTLAGLGVTGGDALGLLAPTTRKAVSVVHAGFRLGVRVVPLSTRLAPPELERRVSSIGLDALVHHELAHETAIEIYEGPTAGLAELEAVSPAPFDPGSWRLDSPAITLFTSGTTGEPSPVTLSAGNLVASACASAFRLGVVPSDRWLLCLPIYHMGGLAPILRSTLYGTAVIVHEGFEPASVADAARRFDATGISLVPTMLSRLLDGGHDLSHLRFVLLGGAPADAELIKRCEEQGVPVHPTYGMTETASQVTTATPAEAFEHPDTAGRPLMGTTVTIVDDAGTPLPEGSIGEITVSGPTVTPDVATAEASDMTKGFDHRSFRTGDLGAIEDGLLFVHGRRSDQIITGGENVHPDEVASVLRDHPAINDVAVVGLDDPEWGERIGALVVADEGTTIADVETHCRGRLADFKRPRTIGFADSLPRTASGTVDRAAVRDRLRECG